jgi:uncharacterized membrane protein
MSKIFWYRFSTLALMITLAGCASQASHAGEEMPQKALAAGVPAGFYHVISWVVVFLEILGSAVIVGGILVGGYAFLVGHLRKQDSTRLYQEYREQMGRAILLGLEFLVGADIINTITVEPNLRNVAALAIIVLVRTFLSFAIEVEIHGRWPWQHGRSKGGIEEQGEPTHAA